MQHPRSGPKGRIVIIKTETRERGDLELLAQRVARVGLEARGTCCGSGCRHCPFDHVQVPAVRRPETAEWLHRASTTVSGPVDVLFWSGGKDSFSAYLSLRDAGERPVVLLTTFDGRSRRVAHQELSIDVIGGQARGLDIDALAVPLARGGAYVEQVERALQMVRAVGPVKRLVFGDLHLEEVKRWRLAMLGPVASRLGATPHFPLWKADYAALARRLEASGATFRVCATNVPSSMPLGAVWTPAGCDDLPAGIDAFGEYGEFHTEVVLPGAPDASS